MNLIKLFICLIIISFSATVSAEFYKYIDENGNICFTDDFNKVPQDQRSNIKGYEESESDSNINEGKTGTVEEEKTQADGEKLESLEELHSRLNNTRSQLIQEDETINKEREQIIKDRQNAKTTDDVININERAKKLNQRQENLKKKNEAFESERKKYRVRVTEEESKQKEVK